MEQHWLTRPAAIRVLWAVFIAILAATVAAELLMPHEARFGIDGTFAFYAWFGFLSCAAFILVAKVLGLLLRRPDSYYDEPHG